MEIQEIVIVLIIGLVFLFITDTFLIAGTQNAKPPELPNAIVVLNKPDLQTIDIGPVSKGANGYVWSCIKVPIVAQYSAGLTQSDRIDVVPIITFHGQEKKATVEGADNTTGFYLTQARPEFSGAVEVKDVTSSDPPVQRQDATVVNNLIDQSGISIKSGQKIWIEAKANGINFTLKLQDVGHGKGDKISEIIDNINTCGGTFELECNNRLYNFNLFAEDVCNKGLVGNCQKEIPTCNSTVTIFGEGKQSDWCSTQTATVRFVGELGNLYTEFGVGERVLVTFLTKDCADKFDQLGSIEQLHRVCAAKDFLGTYSFTAGVVGTSGKAQIPQDQCV